MCTYAFLDWMQGSGRQGWRGFGFREGWNGDDGGGMRVVCSSAAMM